MMPSSLYPIKVVDIDLNQAIPSWENLAGYVRLRALVRLHGTPIGYIDAPITNNRCDSATIGRLIIEKHRLTITRQLMMQGLATGLDLQNLQLEDLWKIQTPPSNQSEFPCVTVAICTRDRAANLPDCLDAITQLNYPNLDILVVDNAPTNQATQQVVQAYPQVRYVCEPRPGLNWARNRAILAAQGEIIAYTDDDVIVDANWVKAIAQVFRENPAVMAVTGLVVPAELATEAQALFEMYGGFGRGFERQWYHVSCPQMPWRLLGTGQLGTGANMAYRRSVFEAIGGFNPALDVGTVTQGAGDLEMFFRVLKLGHTLVYEPSAIVRHRHRRTYSELRTQIQNNGSLYSYFICAGLAYPEEAFSLVWLGLWWLCYWYIRRYLLTWIYPNRFPRDLIVAEIQGGWVGLSRYHQARKIAAQIVDTFGAEEFLSLQVAQVKFTQIKSIQTKSIQTKSVQTKSTGIQSTAIAVRMVELTQLQPLTDIKAYPKVQIFVTYQHTLIGKVEINHGYTEVSIARLLQVIITALDKPILQAIYHLPEHEIEHKMSALMHQRFVQNEDPKICLTRLPETTTVSIIVATYDRPEDLRNCLRHLTLQETDRSLEIIVIDNHPASRLTPPIAAEFPGVRLVSEPRAGVASARNAGIAVSSGEVIVTTDDDVIMPSTWLETLIAPLARSDVMAVSGNILPLQLEQDSQILFESYGGLGRGFSPLEVDGQWFERSWCHAVPTWELGGTANAAFRASLFSDPAIGPLHEALGPGMPSGVGEDSYLFYKILKAGHRLVYEPTAYVWHRHRQDMAALRRQIYNYSKGHVAHHLTTLIQDGDLRAIARILIGLPLIHAYRGYQRLRGQSTYPLGLLALEIAGNLAGFWSLWRSYQGVSKAGVAESGNEFVRGRA